MKKILSILAVSFLMLGMIACDKIEEGDYFKNNGGGGDTPVIPGIPEGEGVAKSVLLEDYTGVQCVNCPAAGEIARQLQQQYGHKVIVLGVHAAGQLSFPIGGFPNFITTEGDTWRSTFGIISFPSGTINRKIYNGNKFLDSPSWADAVAETLQETTYVDMDAKAEYNEGSLKVDVTSTFLAEMPDTYSLTVCVMEDSIVGKQKVQKVNPDDPEEIEDYVHRHVFRKTMNGAWGEVLNDAPIAPEEEIVKTYTMKLDENWNADQCYIIAYVSNDDTKEVLQVIEKKIK